MDVRLKDESEQGHIQALNMDTRSQRMIQYRQKM